MKSKTICALAAGLALALGLPSELREAGFDFGFRTTCTTDLQFPVEIRVLPLDAPAPGGSLRVRVEIESRMSLDGAELQVAGPADLPVVAGRRSVIESLRPGEPVSREFTLILPPDRTRRTVDVRFLAPTEDGPLAVGATLNLAFEDEPSRVVPGPDGLSVREVAARRID